MSSNYFNKCGSCSHLNPNDRNGYRYYCDIRGSYYPLDDTICSRYDYDKYRDYDELYRIDNPSGCYITTIMCNILGFKDNNYYLNTLRLFRENVLQKNIKYLPLLLEYDTVGPFIADCLTKDSQKYVIASKLLNNFIKPMIQLIEEQKVEEAVAIYVKMVNALREGYSLVDVSKEVKDYDATVGGHGMLKKTR